MEAKEALKQIFETFEPNVLIDFFRAIGVRTLTPVTRSYEIIEADTSHFCTPDLLGVIKLGNEDELAVFTVKVIRSLTERSGKKAQYELAKKILKTENRYIAGIFIFHDDKNDFRFSLVYSVPLATGKRDWSNFRRYTYFVSEEQSNKTFIHQITQADFSSVEMLTEAFSVEKVTKAFYAELQNWYFWAMNMVEFPDDEDKDKNSRNAKNLIRLITRIIFIWFMKEKRLIPSSLFDKQFIDNLLNYNDKTGSTYYKAILQNLFFATLNTKMRKDESHSRIFVEDAQKKGYINDAYLQQGYYRYSRFIKDNEKFIKEFENIPFLNGGLFECLDKKIDGKEVRIDCFSDNPKNETRLKVPDEIFFSEEEVEANLSAFLGSSNNRRVRGLIPILKSYNFTTDENTPIDEEIALDPELLGKVFENLLASYNPETAVTARKATGSYYTPREIVEYMVTESLVMHLAGTLGDDPATIEKLKKLFSYSDDSNPFDAEETESIISAIEKIRILDPACGSGAFPMGILHKLVLALHKLDPQNTKWKKRLIEGVPPELQAEVEQSLQNKSLDYIRKLGLIEHCIFGVDIQEIAIQISKLRFFISLLIEQEIDDSKENRDIRALPNLETKFVAANTLIELGESQYLKSQEVINLEEELFNVRERIFYTNSRSEKYKLQCRLTDIRNQLNTELAKVGLPNDKAEEITQWDPFDQNTHAKWFDPEWMFGIKIGFDIVIGNPPYIQLQKAFDDKRKYADLYKDQKFKTFDRTGDIYCLFYEKGINLLCDGGHLAFITSNKWMRAGYGEKLRQFFNSYNPKILIDLGPGVFEHATVDTNILIIQKAKNAHKLHAVTINEKKKANIDFSILLEQNGVILQNLTGDAWFIGSDAEQRLKEKIERIGKPLREWDVNIYRGILTGLNEAFIINDARRKEILDNCKDEAERRRTEAIIKPILRGRDIKRYYYEWAGLWVIVIPSGWTNENRNKENAENFINRQFPALMNHLKQFETKAKKRDDQGDYWWELRACAYYPEFEKEKVVYSEIVRSPQFYYDTDKFYIEATSFLMTGENIKYICGLLNSNPVNYFFRIYYSGGGLGKEGYRYKKAFLENLPIPPITPATEPIVSQIESLVDKILAAKKGNPQADTSVWEKEIDRLVYKLYELTEEEIRIIENKN